MSNWKAIRFRDLPKSLQDKMDADGCIISGIFRGRDYEKHRPIYMLQYEQGTEIWMEVFDGRGNSITKSAYMEKVRA